MKEIKFLATMFWGASLATSWILPVLIETSFFEIVFLLWAIPSILTLVTVVGGIIYCVDNWNESWGGK